MCDSWRSIFHEECGHLMSAGCLVYREQQLREPVSRKLVLFHCLCQTWETSTVVHNYSAVLSFLGFNSIFCVAARMSYLKLCLCFYWILIASQKKSPKCQKRQNQQKGLDPGKNSVNLFSIRISVTLTL